MINFFLPTNKNNYSPKIFDNKFLAVFAIVIFGFNFLSFNYLPNFVNKVQAGSINADDLIQLANDSRSVARLVTLNKNAKLTAAAKAKSEDMFAKGYWAHFGPNGETPWQFIRGAGYDYVFAGENLAKGFSTSTSVQDAWMNSPTHKANILKPEFRDIGIYVANGVLAGEQTILVVQMFGSLTDTSNQNTNTTASSKASSTKSQISSKSKSTSSSRSLDIIAPEKPVISDPQNNKYTNQSNIVVKGSAEKDSSVNIYLNSIKNSEGKAINSAFEIPLIGNLQIGDNLLEALSIDKAGNVSLKSDPVKIVYGSVLPVIDQDNIRVINKDGNLYTLEITVQDAIPLKSISAEIASQVINIPLDNAPKYRVLGVNAELLKLVSGINIHAEDLAGNKSDILIDSTTLNKEFSNYEVVNPSQINNNIFTQTINSISSLSLRQKINLGIALFLLILLIIDGIILFRVKGLHAQRGKSALHIPQLVLVLVILIFSGIGSIT